jgi:hypothetical protein
MPPTDDDQIVTQTVNNVWATEAARPDTEFITLPSGQTCKARRLGLQGVMEAGLIGDADTLTQYVGREFVRKVRGAKDRPDGEEIDARAVANNPEALKRIIKLVDRCTPLIVVEPEVRLHMTINPDDPEDTKMIPPALREPGVIYTDVIGFEDKMFLFNLAMGGMANASRFREQSEAALGRVADGQDVPGAAQRPHARPKRRRPPRRNGS